jgi:hypothetical protein
MEKFLIDCKKCEGSGWYSTNNTWDKDPQWDESHDCKVCNETGKVYDQEDIDNEIENIQYMIDGMITRIRISSDNIMMCAKLECFNLVRKYKHRLQIQARGLGRLEMYLDKLKSL